MAPTRGSSTPSLTDEELNRRVEILNTLGSTKVFSNGQKFLYADNTYMVTADYIPPGEWRAEIERVAGKGKTVNPFYKRAPTENAALAASIDWFVRTRRNSMRKNLKERKEKRQQLVAATSVVVDSD